MADPLSLALAIIPIAAGLLKVTEKLHRTVQVVANAPEQIKSHVSEITMTRQAFLGVYRALSGMNTNDIHPDDIAFGSVLFDKVDAIIISYRRNLRKIRKSPLSGLPTVFGRLQWFLKKGGLGVLQNELQSVKVNMHILLHTINIQLATTEIVAGKASQARIARLKEEM